MERRQDSIELQVILWKSKDKKAFLTSFFGYDDRKLGMQFYNKLYIGESIKHPKRVKWKLRVAAGQFNVHLITISENGDNQLECFHNGLLKQKVFRRQRLFVVGIAADYEEAIGLIEQITADCVNETGTGNIKAFLLDKSS